MYISYNMLCYIQTVIHKLLGVLQNMILFPLLL